MEGLTKLRHVASGENFMAHDKLVSGQFPILNTKANHDAINSLVIKITVKVSQASRLCDGTPLDRHIRLSVSRGTSARETHRVGGGGGGNQGNQSL